MSRRSIESGLGIAIPPVLVGLVTVPASAGLDLSGRVDFSRPLYVEGRITAWRDDRLQLEFTVEAAEADREAMLALAGDAGAVPVAVAGTRLRVEVDPLFSRRLLAQPHSPGLGDDVRLVARCRISDDAQRGVWRLVALQAADGHVLRAQRRGLVTSSSREALALG